MFLNYFAFKNNVKMTNLKWKDSFVCLRFFTDCEKREISKIQFLRLSQIKFFKRIEIKMLL